MEWTEITASWLRERARKLREKADAVDAAYRSERITRYTSRVSAAYRAAAYDFENLADELEQGDDD